MDHFSSDFNFLKSLADTMGVQCPECGQMNASISYACENCGIVLPTADDDEEYGLSFLLNETFEEHTGPVKNPSEEIAAIFNKYSQQLDHLNDVVEKTIAGELSYQEYRENVRNVMDFAEANLNFFEREGVKDKITGITGDNRRQINILKGALDLYFNGIKRMYSYNGSEDGNPILMGFTMADNALKKWREIEDKVIGILE